MDRRSFLVKGVVAGAGVAITGCGEENVSVKNLNSGSYAMKGRIKHSVCQWCYKGMSLDRLAAEAAQMGLAAIDLVGPKGWGVLKKHGLVCSMTPSHGIGKGLNRKENHDECLGKIRKSIEATSAAGFDNVICFSGNRAGMDDDEGMKNCAIALKQVVGSAEKKNVTICMELLNSKRNHKDYMCDRTHWGAELVKRVGSDNFKLLYDIYHMQVQEGDVIATIKEHHECIGHYHTAGVPGRHEIDDSQELYYPAIAKAIVDTGFGGYLAQEFKPKGKDPMHSLREAIRICDV
jgi:hydroxypyruvate isomerase